MGDILGFILPIFVFVIVGANLIAIVFNFYAVGKRKVEVKTYKILIANTNDTTVLAWLDAFKKSRNFITRSGNKRFDNTMSHSTTVDDKLRFVQVWEIIKDNSNVSANVKEQVKKSLLLESIPIKP